MKNLILKNKEGFIEELSSLIVKNEMNDGETVDIYLKVKPGGEWEFREFENPGENSFLCDGSGLVYRINKRSGNEEINRTWKTRREDVKHRYIEFFKKNIDGLLFRNCFNVNVMWI